jgi:Ser/Thr protein kinase RdoA (MazF antagonist)
MLDLSFVSELVETIYGLSPTEIESIQRYTFDWRGIFCVREENERRWVLRLLNHPDAAREFHITATLLDWLNQQHYPVPRVRRTRARQLVGMRDTWALLLLSFIEGEVITPEPANLRLLGVRLGQLHGLAHDPASVMRLSRCHPETIASRTIPQLNAGSQSAPEAFAALFQSLSASMSAIVQMEHLPLGITHGDCWYMNAIKAEAQDVRLIDWDNVGIGAPILDLGYLLLSSHFDLADRPSIKPDRDKIRAIMEGYQGQYHLSGKEVRCLLPAVRFLLAYQLGEYYENNAPLHEEDPFLVKTQQRFNSTATIARLAKTYAIDT